MPTSHPQPSRFLLLILALLGVGVLTWGTLYIHHRNQVPSLGVTPQPTTSPSPLEVSYTSSALGLSFNYPKGWVVEESPHRVYVKNMQGEFNVTNTPPTLQVVWLTDSLTNASAQAEAHTRAGTPDCCTYGGTKVAVTSSTINSANLTIRTYEFYSMLEAHWSGPSGTLYYATISSPSASHVAEVATLKSILATVKILAP